ncbi:MAG: hypothetical protein JWN95_6 [Frankiales bacterium]|nr:hypothetical protein [Frankiales bacterium]
MDQAKNRDMLTAATEELESAKANVRFLQQVVDGLTGLLEMTTSATPSAPVLTEPAPNPAGVAAAVRVTRRDGSPFPKPKDALLEAMRAKPNIEVSPKGVIAWLRDLDLLDLTVSSKAYNTALGRLAASDDNSVKLVRTGRYIYVSHDEVTADDQTFRVDSDAVLPNVPEALRL